MDPTIAILCGLPLVLILLLSLLGSISDNMEEKRLGSPPTSEELTLFKPPSPTGSKQIGVIALILILILVVLVVIN